MAQIGRQCIQFGILVILCRLLTPEDFGLVGMITVFTGFAVVLGNLGFSAALIQRTDLENRHYSSVFWLNTMTGFILTAVVICVAPALASFYDRAELAPLTMLIASTFFFTALRSVQTAMLEQRMEFRLLGIIDIGGIIVSGGAAIVMAMMGFGVWSLVWQTLIMSVATCALTWLFVKWKPRLRCDVSALKELMKFSLNLLGSRSLNYWVRNGDNLLVGKFLGSHELGVYTRAYSTMLLPLNQVSAVLAKVMFPALSRVQHDKPRVKRIYLRSVAMIALITFPMMMGLLVVSDHFVFALFGPQWAAVVPVLQVLSLLGMVQSIRTTEGWIYKSQGRTDWKLRWEIVTSTIILGSILIGVSFGSVKAVAIAYAIADLILVYPAFTIVGKLIGMSVTDLVRSVMGIFACAGTMALLVWGIGALLPTGWSHLIHLALQVAAGGIVYGVLIHALKIESYLELRGLISEQIRLRRQREV